jgi:hypothetical protein
MRARLIAAMAVVGLILGFSQPAAAGWDDSYCCTGTAYVHHHVYYPPRYRHFYHVHAPRPRHIRGYSYAYGCCAPVYAYRPRDYFAPRYYWYWGGRPW